VASDPPARAGRNVPVAIGIGLLLGAAVLVPIYLEKPVFLAVVAAAVVVGMVELSQALGSRKVRAPAVPLSAAALGVLCTSYVYGRATMTDALLLSVGLLVVWRVPAGVDGLAADLGGSFLALLYVALPPGFLGLMLAAPDGDDRATCFIAAVVASDVGGFAAGVLTGRHPLAPRISPKKSWEGLAGSAVLGAVVSVVLLTTLLHAAWWQGVLFGIALVACATLGDLGESMLKRDLGIKDMGSVLPGHGGVLDRLDSLLPSAPLAWSLLAAFVPVR
jgi:phosphatidate cytidylyltransferase